MHCNLVCVFVRCRSGHQWTNDDDENDEMARCRCEAYVGNTTDTTAHLQGSGGVHASMGQGCFGNKRKTNTILDRSLVYLSFSY